MISLPRFTRSFLATAGLLFVTAVALAADRHPKLSPDVSTATSSSVSVIIQYDSDPTGADEQRIEGRNGKVDSTLRSIRAIAAHVPQSSLDSLSKDPNVSYISPDRPVGARQAISSSAEYTTEPINANRVWAQGYDGTGIGVAVIDSGINPLDDLSGLEKKRRSRVVYNQSFLASAPNDVSDSFGHGTHVAGLIAGNGSESAGKRYSRTFYGVAPNVNLINLRVLDENGKGTDSSVISAIETAIALKDIYNIRIINLSLGRPIYESYTLDPLCQAVERAWKAGIMVVAAAGNNGRDLALNSEGYGTIEAPGNDPYALTVGAANSKGTPQVQDDVMASYSSKGPTFIDHVAKPDIVAPGNLVTSLLFRGDLLAIRNPAFVTLESFYIIKGGNEASKDYFPLSGTSMATGVTSGAVALLFQALPNLTPDQVKAMLMRNANRNSLPATNVVTDSTTGVSYTAHNDLLTVGAGYLDIWATLNYAQENWFRLPAGNAMSPVAAYEPRTGGIFLLKNDTAM
jgi:serine protease AprX